MRCQACDAHCINRGTPSFCRDCEKKDRFKPTHKELKRRHLEATAARSAGNSTRKMVRKYSVPRADLS